MYHGENLQNAMRELKKKGIKFVMQEQEKLH